MVTREPTTDATENNPGGNVDIVFLSDDCKGQVLSFSADVISFGRSPDCNVVLRAAPLTVSRVHARIIKKSRFYLFENIGPNGSLVNGKTVQRCELASGDVIQFSDSGPSVRFIAHPKESETRSDSVLYIHNATEVLGFESGTVVIGSAEDCDCIFKGLEPHHALVQFELGACRIKNLAQQDHIYIDGKPEKVAREIQDDTNIQIGRDGPRFKYLGAGRLILLKEKLQNMSSDELRTYIIPAPKPSLFDKFKRPKN